MKIDDRINDLTTLVIVSAPPLSFQGTGFFYHELVPKDTTKEEQWQEITEIWLVTNRHILLPKVNGEETIPTQFTFHLRTIDAQGNNMWLPVSLDNNEILSRAKVHHNSTVDVALLRINDLVTRHLKTKVPVALACVGENDFPGANKVNVEVASDVVIVGYPKGFYDNFNKFPIVKTGIIASRWLSLFQREPKFLIDAKLFPGSSGSIVISKPVNFVIEAAQAFTAAEKQFCFLGVFSGEPYEESKPIETDQMTIILKQSFNVGYVWYFYLIPEIIKNGVTLK